MHLRLSIIFIYTAFLLLITTNAELSHRKDGRFLTKDHHHLRENERNLNTLHNDQLFLTNKGQTTRLNPYIPNYHSDWINSPTLQIYGRRAMRRHGGRRNRPWQTPMKISPHFHSQPSRVNPNVNPKVKGISTFRIRKNTNTRRGHSNPILTNAKTIWMPDNERWYPKDLKGTLYTLHWNSQPSSRQEGQQRMTRSSCTGGKVWRRGRCRCPYSSNFDETQSKCVCIYGTYRDSKGNCRPFL